MIDLETLLHDNPTWDEVVEFWRSGEWYESQYRVAAIKRYLRTPAQKTLLDELDISLDELMSGRYPYRLENRIRPIFKAWNEKLGFEAFNATKL